MNVMEESLFGAKEALSPVVLSLRLEIGIEDARARLQEFYENHKTALSAAYCVTGRNNSARIFRVVDVSQVESLVNSLQDANAHLYSVSPANAGDAVVLAELSRKKQELTAELSNQVLEKTGRLLNTKLEVVKAEHTSAATVVVQEPPSAHAAAAAPVEPLASEAQPELTQEPKPFGFKRGTREDALRMGSTTGIVKPEARVVEAEDYPMDEEDEDLELPVEPSRKKQQLEQLQDMFDSSEQQTQQSVHAEQDIEVGKVEPPKQVTPPKEQKPKPASKPVSKATAKPNKQKTLTSFFTKKK